MPRRFTPIIRIKSILFFVLYNLMGIVHGTLCLLVAPFQSFEQRYRFVNHWTTGAMWLLRVLNGVHIKVEGTENIPRDQGVVVMSNHQSQWETFYLQLLISPQATILKRELLWVPFFGWALALLKPIAINRKQRATALKTIMKVGKQRLDDGISVVIYPEGTRQAPGTIGNFSSGGARLALHADAPILPVVHNAGYCWPARSMKRFPGTIHMKIGKPIDPHSKDVKQINEEVGQWMRREFPNLEH
jgi:1-acyl-sn-glycerol-3-phosphate acyltransferase